MTAAPQPGPRAPALGWLAVAGLCALIAGVYAQVRGHAFVNFDDQLYVTQNPAVLQGLTWRGLR